jgi:single-strand DNA-binding protein
MSARSLNKVILIGNLTRDPELRYTPSGTAVCTFSLATNRDWVDSAGQKQEEVEYTRVVAWNKLAEICSQLLNKGRKVYVEGRLQTRNWQNQEGQERQTTEVVISEMIALGEPKGGFGGETDYVPEPVDSGSSVSSEEAVFSAEDAGGEEKKTAKSSKKSKATEVADDIPF